MGKPWFSSCGGDTLIDDTKVRGHSFWEHKARTPTNHFILCVVLCILWLIEQQLSLPMNS